MMRLGGDRPETKMARMNDVGVWTAHLLRVKFPGAPAHLDVYDDPVIEEARAAISALA